MKNNFTLLFVLLFSFSGISAQEDFTKYVDPTIGNVARFLVPTYPAMHLPNQMLRMFPLKKDYISDQVFGFPLQYISHKDAIIPIKVSLGAIRSDSWQQKMNIDHDLEKVHPWFYSTYLIDDDMRVSFTPGKKSAIFKFDFPANETKNILIQGNKELTANSDENDEKYTKKVAELEACFDEWAERTGSGK